MEEFIDFKDRLTWEAQLTSIKINGELTDDEKKDISISFQNLKTIFGDDFLINIFNSRHPLGQKFVNHAAWTRLWIAWMSDSLYNIKEQDNFTSLIKRIKNPAQYNEGLSVLEIAAKFSTSNLLVDFDPKVIANGKEKMPDLHIISNETNEDFYIEVSTLEKGENLIRNMKLTENLFMSFAVSFSGILLRDLEDEEFISIKTEIELNAERALKENQLITLNIPNIIEIGFAPVFNSTTLKDWSQKKGYRIGNFILPQENFNPTLRLRRKIEAKQKQLPEGKPNILALKMKDVHSLWVDKSALIGLVEEAVNKYDHLFAVIIFDQHMGSPQEELIIQDMNFFLSKQQGNVIVENSFVFFNKFSKIKITPFLMNSIFNSLVHN